MMTSSNENIFRVTGPLCGEFVGDRWIPPHKGQRRGTLMFSLICVWINGRVNNREAGDLRRYRTHFDVTVMLRARLWWLISIIHNIMMTLPIQIQARMLTICTCTEYGWRNDDKWHQQISTGAIDDIRVENSLNIRNTNALFSYTSYLLMSWSSIVQFTEGWTRCKGPYWW